MIYQLHTPTITCIGVCALALSCSGGPPEADAPVLPSAPFVAFSMTSMVIDRLEVPFNPPYATGSSPSAALVRSSNPAVVGVNPSGDLIGHRNGEATLYGSTGASLRVLVQAAKTVEVIPHRVQLVIGGRREIDVLANGQKLSAEALRWQTTDPNIAAAFGSTVQAGLTIGIATLTVSVGDTQASIDAAVIPASGTPIKVEPPRLAIAVGGTQQLRVSDVYATARWTTSDPEILQPLQNGTFLAKAVGSARACAVYADQTSCSRITVTR